MTVANLAPIPELYVSYDSAAKLKREAAALPSWDLTARQLCDLELLMNGGFHPLTGFLGQADYESVRDTMRTKDGALWPMPVTLDVSEKFAEGVTEGQDIALRDAEGVILAILSISDIWTPDRAAEAHAVFGTTDIAHPAVNYLMHKSNPVYIGGAVTGIQAPVQYDYRGRRDTPNELRAYFRKMGWRRVVAFQTRNPLHRAHQEAPILFPQRLVQAQGDHRAGPLTEASFGDHASQRDGPDHRQKSTKNARSRSTMRPPCMNRASSSL